MKKKTTTSDRRERKNCSFHSAQHLRVAAWHALTLFARNCAFPFANRIEKPQMEHYRKWPKMVFIYLTKCQMALPSPSMEIYYEFHSSYDTRTNWINIVRTSKFMCTKIAIKILLLMVLRAPLYSSLLFAFGKLTFSLGAHILSLQAIRQHNKIKIWNNTAKKSCIYKKSEKYNNRPKYTGPACNWMRTTMEQRAQEGANKWTTQIIIAWHSRTYLFPHSNAPQAIKSITITALKLWYWIKVTRPFVDSDWDGGCIILSMFSFRSLWTLILPYLQLLECHRTTATARAGEKQKNLPPNKNSKKKNWKQYFMSSLFIWHVPMAWAQVFSFFSIYFSFRCLNVIASYICLIDHHAASVVTYSGFGDSKFEAKLKEGNASESENAKKKQKWLWLNQRDGWWLDNSGGV